jgi:hypothetical protein
MGNLGKQRVEIDLVGGAGLFQRVQPADRAAGAGHAARQEQADRLRPQIHDRGDGRLIVWPRDFRSAGHTGNVTTIGTGLL